MVMISFSSRGVDVVCRLPAASCQLRGASCRQLASYRSHFAALRLSSQYLRRGLNTHMAHPVKTFAESCHHSHPQWFCRPRVRTTGYEGSPKNSNTSGSTEAPILMHARRCANN